MEGRFIAIIDIVSSSKKERNSTAGIGGASTGVISTVIRSSVISTGVIPIHHIRVGDGDGADSDNANNSDDAIVFSSSLSYWGRTNKQTKEEILLQCVVCVKNKRGPKVSR